MSAMKVPPSDNALRTGAIHVVRTLQSAGFIAYWAGGCVRDALLERPFTDVDIATNALPDDVLQLFPKAWAVGKSFGVILVQAANGLTFEVATFRRESQYTDGRHPDTIAFTDAEEDAQRRDFTINALFYDPITDQYLDFVNGRRDLEARLIRTVGPPEDRFKEDHLRMLRAVRFASVLGFRLDPATLKGIQCHADQIQRISVERVQQEITRLLTESPFAGEGLKLLHKTGLLAIILPEVEAMIGVEQPPAFHPEGDVFTHTCLMLDQMKNADPILAYSVLLHDVGKPPTARWGAGADGEMRMRFDGHDRVGAEMAKEILTRLRCPGEWVRSVSKCVANHMKFMHIQEMRTAKRRRWMGDPLFPTEAELHRLDCLSSHGDTGHFEFAHQALADLENETILPPRWISGTDLIAMGVPEGPDVGRWIQTAYDKQLDGEIEDAAALQAWLKAEIARDQSS